jgi:hypothetical protein
MTSGIDSSKESAGPGGKGSRSWSSAMSESVYALKRDRDCK